MLESDMPGKVLLVVDQSSFIIERLLNILNDIKIIEKVLTTTNYSEAVNILEANETDIVLLDIQLPGKNGIELLKYIGLNFPEIKVIILSNLISEYYQRLCKKLGAVTFIDKSKDFDQLPKAILAVYK